MKATLAALAMGLLCTLPALPAVAADDPGASGTFKIGIVTDLTGTLADLGGPGSGVAAQLAIDDVGGKVLGRKVELLVADHQQKADVGLAIAREWFERRGVIAIVDVLNSSIALGINDLARQYNRLGFYSSAATDRLSEDACNGFGFSWNTDTYAQTNAVAQSMVKQGQDTWFFITSDNAYGHAMVEGMDSAVRRAGGKVLGVVRHPLGTLDFSSYLLQARATGAKVVATGSSGKDVSNTIKQAREFGLPAHGQRVVALLPYITDIDATGLEQMQGLEYIDPWYWDMDEQTRAFAQRFYARFHKMPTSGQAGTYSSTLQYLKAVEAIKSYDAQKVRAYLMSIPINDMFSRNGKLLPNGRMIHDMYLVKVKTPAESKRQWDYEKIVATVPAATAFKPLSESACKIRN